MPAKRRWSTSPALHRCRAGRHRRRSTRQLASSSTLAKVWVRSCLRCCGAVCRSPAMRDCLCPGAAAVVSRGGNEIVAALHPYEPRRVRARRGSFHANSAARRRVAWPLLVVCGRLEDDRCLSWRSDAVARRAGRVRSGCSLPSASETSGGCSAVTLAVRSVEVARRRRLAGRWPAPAGSRFRIGFVEAGWSEACAGLGACVLASRLWLGEGEDHWC